MAKTRTKRTWEDARALVEDGVPQGKVVTYGDIAQKLYGRRNVGSAIGSMMKAWAAKDPKGNLSHRVVASDGSVPNVPTHRARLLGEKVRFTNTGKVILKNHRVKLK